jgi:hypothetical protein
VELDGYSSGQGQPVTEVQRVTSEMIGDASCGNMRPLPSDGGRQHYVTWNISALAYCLDAVGTITSTVNGSVVHFEHKQQWGPPAPCSNAYLSGQTCITQHERWWDDNGHPYGLGAQPHAVHRPRPRHGIRDPPDLPDQLVGRRPLLLALVVPDQGR